MKASFAAFVAHQPPPPLRAPSVLVVELKPTGLAIWPPQRFHGKRGYITRTVPCIRRTTLQGHVRIVWVLLRNFPKGPYLAPQSGICQGFTRGTPVIRLTPLSSTTFLYCSHEIVPQSTMKVVAYIRLLIDCVSLLFLRNRLPKYNETGRVHTSAH